MTTKSPLDALTSTPMVIAYIHRTHGAEGAENLLRLVADVLTREALQDASALFRKLGLLDLAKITKRAARRAKPAPPPDARKRWLLPKQRTT